MPVGPGFRTPEPSGSRQAMKSQKYISPQDVSDDLIVGMSGGTTGISIAALFRASLDADVMFRLTNQGESQ
jgi:hypothetical protein